MTGGDRESPVAGLGDDLRGYRLKIARQALERYDRWQRADGGEGLDFDIVGQLAACTRWLTEELWQENPGGADAGEKP